VLEKAMLNRDRDDWVTELQKGAHWVCPVKSVLEIANDEHLVENDMIAEIDDPLRGPIRQLNTPFKLSETPPSVRYPVPSFAEHSSEIAEWLGYSGSEVNDLIDDGVMKQRTE
jgi:formyl-CoA transferase